MNVGKGTAMIPTHPHRLLALRLLIRPDASRGCALVPHYAGLIPRRVSEFILLIILMFGSSPVVSGPAVGAPTRAKSPIKLDLGQVPLSFERNVGQAAAPVQFVAHAAQA